MKIERHDRAQVGFTMVELLLGMVIAAIIGLTVYNMFWTSMRLDDRMRRVYENYIEVLMADQALTHDLENAITLDLSASFPDAVIFDGHKDGFALITQTPAGIRRVSYYSGQSNGARTRTSTIGRIVNPANTVSLKGGSGVEFLLRQESSLADWLNETTDDTTVQIVASGIRKGSFDCQYAPYAKELHLVGAKALDYQDAWDAKGLPLAVSCRFVLNDASRGSSGLMFKRDIFLAPVASFHHEQ